ncbi:MAG TPA: 2-oxo acid dehydrogenase subunit E2, partial [Acidimicrobiia bacterium]|nr:2-oxo acid dehydrogenase subunit E2 [Acidimicrobiia bacterium]
AEGEAPAAEEAPVEAPSEQEPPTAPEEEPAEAPSAEAPSEEAPAAEAPAEGATAAEESAEGEPAAEPPAEPAPEPSPAAAPYSVGGNGEGEGGDGMRRVLSPVVRKLARDHGLDLAEVPGTGQGGRITRQDVEAFLAQEPEERPAAVTTAPAPPAAPAAPAPAPAAPAAPAPAPAPAAAAAEVPSGPGDRVEDLDRLRARIGENMIRAKQTAAHVWTSVEVDFEAVERVRQEHRDSFKQREGFSLTYLPFIARATIDALRAFPVVNSSFYLEQRKAVFHDRINLGIAIDLDQKGLIVATIRDADELRLVAVARRVRELADKARNGKLEPDDVIGSSFTITNPGPYGSFMSAPVINVPNVGILSTDTVAKRPTVITDEHGQDGIAIRHMGYLGLSWDHRAFDGSTAVMFLGRIKENLQTWDWTQELA